MGFFKLQMALVAVVGMCVLNILLGWHSKALTQSFAQRAYNLNYSLNTSNLSLAPDLADSGGEVGLVNISSFFKDFIPAKNNVWNLKQHQMFRLLDSLRLQGAAQYRPSRACNASAAAATPIADAASYSEAHRDFLRYMDCKDYPQRLDHPGKCEGGAFLLLVVKSVVANFERRQAVRETWGREGTLAGARVLTLFLLGSASGAGRGPDLQGLLDHEDRLHGDILQWEFKDTLYNLTLKDYLFLRWATAHCLAARYVFKGDDDIFLNTPVLLGYLQSLEAGRGDQLYVGQTIVNASPLRDKKSKYSIPLPFYDGAYPAYAGGGGFLYSGRLLPSLYAVSHYIPFFPIDDVFTGMCFSALGVPSLHHAGFRTFDIEAQRRDDPCAHADLILVHQRSPQQTTQLWRALYSPDLKC
uniref:N-acetyllactosaminide beta-1,3-N-acetylglucosaminyltransferase 2-like n=1 Tax=Pristiophorus japonicus TaxID=55135 RepID=UPI00398EAE42